MTATTTDRTRPVVWYCSSLDEEPLRQYLVSTDRPLRPQMEPENRHYTGITYDTAGEAGRDLDRLNGATQ